MPREELDPAGLGRGITCRACKRSLDPTTRYCPFDGQELMVPIVVAPQLMNATFPAEGALRDKICPSCTHRYAADDVFCAGDGSELVALN